MTVRSVRAVIAALLLLAGGAHSQPVAPPRGDEMVVAIYLPGLYFSQLAAKVELGTEIAEHLSLSLGRRVTARVYATPEAMQGDRAPVMLALVEAPYVAARLGSADNPVVPLCTASVNGREDTRLLVMGGGLLSDVRQLGAHRLAYVSLPELGPKQDIQDFLVNFVFEGELPLAQDHLEPARDAASALSKVSLKKAEAVLLYEDDAAQGRKAGLRTLYESPPLPRPTLVLISQSQGAGHGVDEREVQRLREVMARFAGRAHPQLRSFRPAVSERFAALQQRIQHRNQRLPPFLELAHDAPGPRLPRPATADLPAPLLRVYAPRIAPPSGP